MIDFNHTKQYTLSIRLSTDGFCFAVHDPQADNQYAYHPYSIDPMKSLTANFKAAVREVDMLKHTYAKVNVLLAGVDYTIVPKEYYAESCERELYVQNFPQTSAGTVVLRNFVGDEQAVVLFGVERLLYQYISERFAKAEVYASVSPLVDYGVERSCAGGRRYCLAYLRKHDVDVLCFDGGALLFANTFGSCDTSDMLYFLLNTWQVLGLSQTEDTLHVAGTSRNAKKLAKELERFIKMIHTIRPTEEFHSTELARIGEIPFDLQTLIACE